MFLGKYRFLWFFTNMNRFYHCVHKNMLFLSETFFFQCETWLISYYSLPLLRVQDFLLFFALALVTSFSFSPLFSFHSYTFQPCKVYSIAQLKKTVETYYKIIMVSVKRDMNALCYGHYSNKINLPDNIPPKRIHHTPVDIIIVSIETNTIPHYNHEIHRIFDFVWAGFHCFFSAKYSVH